MMFFGLLLCFYLGLNLIITGLSLNHNLQKYNVTYGACEVFGGALFGTPVFIYHLVRCVIKEIKEIKNEEESL